MINPKQLKQVFEAISLRAAVLSDRTLTAMQDSQDVDNPVDYAILMAAAVEISELEHVAETRLDKVLFSVVGSPTDLAGWVEQDPHEVWHA
jgi:hypothetical protein